MIGLNLRMKAIWYIITTPDFILVRIFRNKDRRKIAVLTRTDDSLEGDVLSLKGAYFIKEKQMGVNVPSTEKEVVAFENNNEIQQVPEHFKTAEELLKK